VTLLVLHSGVNNSRAAEFLFVQILVAALHNPFFPLHAAPLMSPQNVPKAQVPFSFADSVTDLIRATPEDDVLRRDIFDRPPIFKWTQGRVALLGDSAHAMQPNLGQVSEAS